MTNSSVEAPPASSTGNKRARLMERLRQAVAREACSPLSFAQQRLWFLDQLVPDTALYNVPLALRLTGSLNVPALEKALQNIVARHEALRTRFEWQGDTPVQVISSQVEFKLRVIAASPAEAEKIVREEVQRPFKLQAREPLLRAALVAIDPNEHLLALTLHHIVADEWSLKILGRELEEFYQAQVEGRTARLPQLPIQYADYAVWQKNSLNEESLQSDLRFWKEQLDGKPPVTELMLDKPRTSAPSFVGHTVTRVLNPDLVHRFKQLARNKEVTPFMMLFAAFNALVHRYTGLEDVIIGTPVAGRNSVETEGLIGFFVNTLLLRTSLAEDPTFDELLQRVKSVALGAYAHQELPFDKLIEALRPERSLSHLVFSNIMFALQTPTDEVATLPGLKVECLDVDTATSKFDLTFVIQDFNHGMTVRVEYNSALFMEGSMQRLLEHFENLLDGIVANPAQPISKLPLLGNAEERQLIEEWNSNTTDYPKHQCIHQLFESQVRQRADEMAVCFGRQTLTYGELNAQANQLAHWLARQSIEPGAPVAICMERSVQTIVGLLAILKAGGAYVPMDTRYPKERLSFMLADSGASVVITKSNLLPLLPSHGVKTVCLDTENSVLAKESSENLPNRSTADHLAYIIYTSGSTGQPKGVAVPHRAVNRLVLNANYIELNATDRIAQVSNMSFDAATFEIWGALLNGGQLRGISVDVALSSKDFARELREQGITAMFLTSALFNQVAGEVPGAFETLRTLIVGGEALDPKSVRAVLKDRPPSRLLNGYGPTENTTFTCCGLVRHVPDDAKNVPIGRPISNTQVYILDAHRQPVPIGVPGELYTGGAGLARGYWNRPELTAEKFILHQVTQDGPGQRLYRTGDLARYLPDGNIEFLGRIDNQVKIRGFRVELGEIEAVLGRFNGVSHCAVKLCPSTAGPTRLVAYFVPVGKRAPKSEALRNFLAAHLPDYMIPSAWVQLETWPLTSNGKVDRAALPDPDHARPSMEKKYASPRDAVESELTRIWEEVLGVEPIGIEDQFFALGGHSLLAVRVTARIEKAFGRKLPLAAIFAAPTIERLAAVIRNEMREGSLTADTSLVELQGKGTKPPLFLVHGAGGGMFWGYVNLARQLGVNRPVFGLSSRGLEGRAEFETIEEMAAHYVSDLQVIQPRGPYYLGGYCFGGNVAYEMARQLQSSGEEVALLALLNCAPPNSRYFQARWTPTWCLRFLSNLWYWLQYCRHWTTSQRHDFMRWKWGRLKKWLGRGWGQKSAAAAALEPEGLIDLASLPEQQRELWQAHIRALMKFHPQPYAGRIHLFRSPGHPLWCSFEPDYGWGDLTCKGVAISIVPGAHEKILEEPWVKDTAVELKKVLQPSREGQLAFWKRELEGAPTRLELPTDLPHPASRTNAIGVETQILPKSFMEQTKSTDLSLLVVTAWNIVLARYSGQEDVLMGIETEGEQGANTVVLRTSLAGNPSGRDLLARVRTARTAVLQHADFPFKDVLAEICPGPDSGFNPLVQVLFAHGQRQSPEGFDVRLNLIDNENGSTLKLEYSEDLFYRATMQRMLGHILTVMRLLVEEPQLPLSNLSIMAPAEENLLLNEWNRTERDYPREKTLIQLFEEQVARTPSAEALICGSKRLTYRELCERARQVAQNLQALGVGNQSLVGICLERSEDMVAGILGTLRAGGAYVPLDPAYPSARLAFTAQDAGLRVVLTRRKLRDILPVTNIPVLCIEDLQPLHDRGGLTSSSGPSDLAYVLYTSGSTGQPKGVALEHRSAVAFVSWAREVFQPDEMAGVLACTSICFDLSVFEMFVPLSWGGKVILADNALALPALPAANEVTLVNTVPSAIRELLRIKGVPSSVRVINLAGEPLATNLVEQIYKETSAQKVYDLYGPTETTTYSTFTLRKPGEPPTIGRPLANEQVYIFDQQMRLAPIGIPGDLYIGGAGLARGYLNRPAMTDERFLAHPFKPGARIYKTGDIARWRADGNLEYLGRSDHQVKIRGFRVELGEIEAVLKSHPGLADAIVIAREDRPGEKRLAAYVVARQENKVPLEELRRVIREKLPEYMIPACFVFLRKLPQTPNGKVDRQALPKPQEEERDANTTMAAPRTELEQLIAAIWSEVLELKSISATENFFELGGHSLLAIQVISRLRASLKVELPLSCLFEAPTMQELAAGLAGNRWKSSETQVPPLKPISRGSALPASFIQEQLWFLNQLDPASDAYNEPVAIRFKGPLDAQALQRSLDLIVQRHEALRTTLRFCDGNLTQRVARSVAVKMDFVELRDGNEAKLMDLLGEEARRAFDLEHGPLIRARLVRINALYHALVIVMQHAASDGWSLDILFRELETNYRALTSGSSLPALAPLPVQYADYANWQRNWMQGAGLEKELTYWRERLAGAPLTVDLPGDRIESSPSEAKAARQILELPKKPSFDIAKLGQDEGATTFMVLMSALAITLHKWTGQTDMVLGTVVAGRNRQEIEGLIGCFMNFLPLRVKVPDAATGLDVLRSVKKEVIDGQDHQDCPFEKIVETIKAERRPGRNPLYNVALLFQNVPALPQLGAGMESSPIAVHVDAPLLDLRFEANETQKGLALACEYNSNLFHASTIEHLLSSFRSVVETLTQAPQTKLENFALQPELRRAEDQTIAISATFTADPIEEPLRFWLDELQIPGQIKFAPFNQVFQQLLDSSSLLSANRRGLNVVLVRLEDWAGKPDSGVTSFGQAIQQGADELVRAIRTAVGRRGAPIFICFCPGSMAVADDLSKTKALAHLESSLTMTLGQMNGLYVSTTVELLARYPVANFEDLTAEELGHIPYTPAFFTGLATLIARKFHALHRPVVKVIALDCDQTLWAGVCGEDGPKGICLDPSRKALQEFMLRQQESGKLLVACSKNDEKDVIAVFNEGIPMPLRREHFAAWRVNWRPKSESLKSLAQELNLGLDSFILIDDNPLECAEVEANCPEVLTLQLPEDPALIPQFLDHCWAFDQLKTTAEDKDRASMYLQNQLREQSLGQAMSFTDFISGLQLEIQITPALKTQWARLAQLTQRTNQFNVSGRRRSENELALLSGQYEILTVTVRDRFGDYGLVGVIIFEVREQVLWVDTFLLSCRALGKGVEHRMLARLGEVARERGAEWVEIPFERLPRNQPALDFLESVGSPHKQAQQYRFPADLAASVVFDPGCQLAPSVKSETDAIRPASKTRKFAQCRSIALELNDVAHIQARVEARFKLQARSKGGYAAPRTAVERQLCELWQKLLRIERVGIEDDFFEMGGHSLLAVGLFTQIEKMTGRKLPLVTLFQAPTIAQLAAVLNQDQAADSRSLLVPIQPCGSKPPLYLIHGAGGDVLWGYANLVAYMDPEQPIYGVKSRGQIGLDEAESLEHMAACYLQAIRAQQPEGPYYLGGYCFGGNVAYEMARQIQADGGRIALLALLDSAPANSGYETVQWWRPEFLGLFGRNLFYWLQDFREVKPQDRRRFVERKLRTFGRKLARWVRQEDGDNRVDLEEVIDPAYFPENELKLWELHLRALAGHVQQPFAGHVTLFRTRGHPLLSSFARDLRWGTLAKGGVTVRMIPGSHENIFLEPHVKTLAFNLTAALAATQERPTSKNDPALLIA